MNANPVDRNNTSGKRNCDDFDLDIEELLDLPPPSKKERIGNEGKEEVEEEADVDDYMQHEHTTTEPTLEFSVTPHRKTIGIRSSEVITQICATIKACELPLGVHARAPVDIVVALDVSGSMVSKRCFFYSSKVYHLIKFSPFPSSSILLLSVLISLIYVRRLLNCSFMNFIMMIDSVSFHSRMRQSLKSP